MKQERFSGGKDRRYLAGGGERREARRGPVPRRTPSLSRPSTAGGASTAGLDTSDVQRLKELTSENARLKRLLAERDLEVDALKELLAKTGKHGAATSGSQLLGRARAV